MIHGRNYASGTPGAHLVALADPEQGILGKARRELGIERGHTDYRELLEDPDVDAVVVVAPTASHAEIVIQAAGAGKHVFCEKPMALNPAECRSMIEACRRAGVKLQIGFMRRFDAGFRQAKNQIDKGQIGDVVMVKSLTHGPSVPRRWMLDVSKSNGPLAEVNSHDIDTLRWFAGSEFAEIFALAGNYRCGDISGEYPDFYDTLLLSARFENGMMGCIDGAASVGYGYDARLEVLGTRGILFVGSLHGSTVVRCTPKEGITSEAVQSWRSLFSEAYRSEAAAFVRCILENGEPEVGGRDGLAAAVVVSAGNESIRSGAVVTVKGDRT
jgi:myo-inositol 2-dehydrogenase/D-chiro-inositol 1-dehydrogenase/scyllo-inositol 2-dehydrogenase (NAD+)